MFISAGANLFVGSRSIPVTSAAPVDIEHERRIMPHARCRNERP